jgi:hypothetical protein
MEKRRFKRVRVNLKAERIAGHGKHSIFIENMSEYGIFMIIPRSDETKKFAIGRDIDLKLHLIKGGSIDLNCRVRWSCPEATEKGITDSIGLEILMPPEAYINFVRALH